MPTSNKDELERFEDCVIRSYPTGSRYICNPPVMDTDIDTVILVNGYHDYDTFLTNNGWERCGEYVGGEMQAYRKGEENYIVVEDPDIFRRYVDATEAAKALNLTNKEDRIKLFEAIRWAPSNGYPGLYKGVKKYKVERPAFLAVDEAAAIGEVLPDGGVRNHLGIFEQPNPLLNRDVIHWAMNAQAEMDLDNF